MARKTKAKTAKPVEVEQLRHPADSRKNIPTAEMQGFLAEEEAKPKRLKYERNTDLDPQLMWRGKDAEDAQALTVEAVPIYIQEKVKPHAIIEELRRQSKERRAQESDAPDLFADFNGLHDVEAQTDFYQHDKYWSNRMILGDALLVMASLAEKENLRGKVQCIYIDPPYGIRFNSNWQFSTKSRDVQDGKAESVTREPEVIKAFRDTWEDGINSYLSYLRDRLIVARELLTESGSIFVQIGDENVHRVRALMDEVFGEENFISQIMVWKTSSQTSSFLSTTTDYIIWFARNRDKAKFRQPYALKDVNDPSSGAAEYKYFWNGFGDSLTEREHSARGLNLPRFRPSPTTSQSGSEITRFTFEYQGRAFRPGPGGWKTNQTGFSRLAKAGRLIPRDKSISYVRFLLDFAVQPVADLWTDVRWGFDAIEKRYVVETNPRVMQRCILMTTDPGDLVLDPTCGSGTTAYVAEQWGRRWITIDTSRVALALARQRLMTARFPYYYLMDSEEGARKEAEISGKPPLTGPFEKDLHLGFVYERVPHITLKSIANNAEIDTIHERWQAKLEPLLAGLNKALRQSWEEWEIPREPEEGWPETARKLHAEWWEGRIERQREIDASIARNADPEYLYDRPYERPRTVRVTGPFTVESLSPHRVLPSDADDEVLLDALDEMDAEAGRPTRGRRRLRAGAEQAEVESSNDFARVVLENLKSAGIENTKKNERLTFTLLKPWPGSEIHAEGRYLEGGKERRVAIHIGPEFGTVGRSTIIGAAREAQENGFDTLVVCGFAFDAMSAGESFAMGRLNVLTARMNQDLYMSDRLRKTGAANLFVVFGEPDIELKPTDDGLYRVEIKGVDIFDPTTGEVKSSEDPQEDIACWFIDTNYDQESFFIRQAYFLGGSGKDAYDKLRRALKAEIDEEAWESLNSTVSRPFPKPTSGRIAVKVINHLGDEVMRIFPVK